MNIQKLKCKSQYHSQSVKKKANIYQNVYDKKYESVIKDLYTKNYKMLLKENLNGKTQHVHAHVMTQHNKDSSFIQMGFYI